MPSECGVELLDARITKQLYIAVLMYMYKKSRQDTITGAEAAELRTRSEYNRHMALPRICGLNWVNKGLCIGVLKFRMDSVKLFRTPQ